MKTSRQIFDAISLKTSERITHRYSTSFSLAIRLIHSRFRNHIYSIYGFVRLADEIVDSFHDQDKERLLKEFTQDTFQAISDGFSLNPILNSFQKTVNEYGIENEIIQYFLDSMEMDLVDQNYDEELYKQYIMGSAEAVGLMCLKVFVEGDEHVYLKLRPAAKTLGSAFQKINFLRDLHEDQKILNRNYFPTLASGSDFNEITKQEIEKEIEKEFAEAYKGIIELPTGARFGVLLAYKYYTMLFKKIRTTSASKIASNRIRISNRMKYRILASSYIRNSFNLL